MNVVPRTVKPEEFYLTTSLAFAKPSEAPAHALVDMSQFRAQPNAAEFELVAIRLNITQVYYACCNEPYPVIEVEFEMARGVLTVLFGMIFPIIMVTCVGFCTLWMPAPQSGARPVLSVTVMLTTSTIYLVASRLTPQSNTSTSLSRLYIFCFICSAILVVISIINTALCLIQPEDQVSASLLKDIFAHYDSDSSGYLEQSEASLALQSLGLSADDQIKVWETFDADGDNRISMEEFMVCSSVEYACQFTTCDFGSIGPFSPLLRVATKAGDGCRSDILRNTLTCS